jgi:hypothetical protein
MTDVRKSLACFCFEVKLFLDESIAKLSATESLRVLGCSYSAAVWELSDIWDILLVRGFAEVVVDFESAMVAIPGAIRAR